MAASSFDGSNIRIELDLTLASSPTWARQAYLAVRHIPGSDTDVVQVLGVGSEIVTYRLLLSAAEYTALSGKLLDEGTLIVAGASQGTCLLEDLSGPERHVDGWTTVQATFRKVS